VALSRTNEKGGKNEIFQAREGGLGENYGKRTLAKKEHHARVYARQSQAKKIKKESRTGEVNRKGGEEVERNG